MVTTVDNDIQIKIEIEIKTLPSWTVAYVRTTDIIDTDDSNSLSKAFHQLMAWAEPYYFWSNATVLGVFWDIPQRFMMEGAPQKHYRDAAIVIPDSMAVSDEVKRQTLSGGLYAVYHCEVPSHNHAEPWQALIQRWLPNSGHRLDDRPCLEIYRFEIDDASEGLWVLDIYLPLTVLHEGVS